MKLEILIGKVAAKKLEKAGITNITKISEQDIEYIAGKQAAQKISAARDLLIPIEPKKQIRKSQDAWEHFMTMKYLDHEEFQVIALNRANKVLEKITISVGGQNSAVVDMKILFRRLLAVGASGFIAAHNHPSGNKTPSEGDIQLTKRMIEAGNIIEIRMYDHIIIADNDYFSFADEGYI